MSKIDWEKYKYNLLLAVIFITATFLRFWNLDTLPNGIQQDEALTGYNAYALLTTGKDAWGYVNPVYLMAWGSGTSILYAWLVKVFLYLFGVSVWALRFPQALMGVLNCVVFYLTLLRIYDKKTALLGVFIFSIMPWGIMNSRWGLDANIAVSFAMLGFYFFCGGQKNSWNLLIATFFYGLSMYAYATFWPFIVAIMALQYGYLLCFEKSKKCLLVVICCVQFFVIMCVPLVWLILVNWGVVEEYRGEYFSIPKLLFWRGGELGFGDLFGKLKMFSNIFIKQNDGWITNSIPQYGFFYIFSPVFMLIGIIKMIEVSRKEIKNKVFSFNLCVLVQIGVGILYGISMYAFSNRVNFLFVPLMVAVALGVMAFKRIKTLFYGIIVVYLVCFMSFCKTYFTSYNDMITPYNSYAFSVGLRDALNKADEIHKKENADIYLLEELYAYAKVLFYDKVNPEEYIKTVLWYDYPNAFEQARSFTHYNFIWTADYENLETNKIYIAHKDKIDKFADFSINEYGNYIVAFKK